jgi:phosphatidylserine/phosphatidylglycerophosphate/cardiolipin synthase-like enzyme
VFSFLHRHKPSPAGLLTSRLFNDATFYPAFVHDLNRSRIEVIIESPFITVKRAAFLAPILIRLKKRGARVVINTRDPDEHEALMQIQARIAVKEFQEAGIEVLYTDKHHRKLAILDGEILWEGSLNILSQNDSCEIMRRIESKELAAQLLQFVSLSKFVR